MLLPLRVAIITPLEQNSYKKRLATLFGQIEEQFKLHTIKRINRSLPDFDGSILLGSQGPVLPSMEIVPMSAQDDYMPFSAN